MKKLLSLFFAISLTLSACGTVSTQPAPPTQTGTPTVKPTTTQTPTSSITPLPTIPTFTPTFDVSTILTVTPAEKAECPKEDSNLELEFQFPKPRESLTTSYSNQILNYLNKGGELDKIIRALQIADVNNYYYMDITGDDVKEFFMVDFGVVRNFLIFHCQAGLYKLFAHGMGNIIKIENIQDFNENGLLEVVVSVSDFTSSGVGYGVIEWDGKDFSNIAQDMYIAVGTKNFEIKDTNLDGVFEFILVGNVISTWYAGDYYNGAPWRDEILTFHWNGDSYILNSLEYMSPEFRFQAVQDGDRYSSMGWYDKALAAYQETIFNSSLEWFSANRKLYIKTLGGINGENTNPTPPSPDSTEYPSLAAYAYYRILLLHLVQGQDAEAASTYQTLQNTFGADPYAAPYVEMATAFWEAYQSAQRMYDGCAAAIQYAVEHPEILTPLGSDYHGWQSHIYVPADVCPFR